MHDALSPARTAVAIAAVALVVGLIGFDGTLHWDEPGYLYAGIYQTLDEILRAEVQPSGLPDFTTGKLLHILFVRAVFLATGSPPATALLVAVAYTVLLGLALGLAYRLTVRLLPDLPGAALIGVLVVALTPTTAYLAFKTLADVPALFLGAVATLAILRAATAGRARGGWLALGILCLAMAALAKAQSVVLPASFVLAAVLVPVGGLDRRRVLIDGAVVGLTAGALAVLVLAALSIDLERLAGSSDLLVKESPLVAELMHVALTGGVGWLVLPLSLLTTRRRALCFFWAWFLLATAPFLALFAHVEPRYLAGSLVPLTGLAALAVDGVRSRFGPVFERHRRLAAVAAGALALLLLATNVLAMRVMPHEVALLQLRDALARIDARYGAAEANLLTTWRYTDFHILRVLWPERRVYDVDSTPLLIEPRSARSAAELADAYLDGRQLTTAEGLRELDGALLLIGFEETFAPVNLARLVDVVQPGVGRRLLESLDLVDHLETSWVWHAEDLPRAPLTGTDHYRLFELRPGAPSAGPGDAAAAEPGSAR